MRNKSPDIPLAYRRRLCTLPFLEHSECTIVPPAFETRQFAIAYNTTSKTRMLALGVLLLAPVYRSP